VPIPVIEIQNLSKTYGDKKVVDNLNLTVYEGEVFGLLGPNGAGKSTTILMLLGLTELTEGQIHIAGIDVCKNPVEVKRITGYLPEDVGFYDNLTALENISYTAQLNGISRSEAIEKAQMLLKRVGLEAEMNKKAGQYSRGMRQRLGLADVLIKSPKVIILDEPTLGIDPSGMKEFLDLIIELSREDKITVLFSSHHLHQVQQVCDRVGIFVNGTLIADGNIQQLSEKLFTHGHFQIEFALENNPPFEQIKSSFKELDGIDNIEFQDNKYLVETQNDITSKIARHLVNKGFDLKYLNKKEYGLDEIYQRYFLNVS
jgi:ABC-2 type transport system ATP-binding protein